MRSVLLLALVMACSFPTRSGDFACKLDDDCDRDRACDHGVCVVTTPTDASRVGDARGDAPPGTEAGLGSAGDAGVDAPPPVCDGSGLVCNGTLDVQSCGSACWISCTDKLTEPQAVAHCAAWHGKLTPLRTETDIACFQLVSPADPAWSGLEQKLNQGSPGSGWSWDGDGVTPTSIPWSSGEPNDSDGSEDNMEQCAYVDGLSKLSDKVCTTPYPYACKR